MEIVDFYEDDSVDERKIAVCSRCLKFGIESVLKNRIYPDNQIPIDHDQWLQCHNCGLVVPIHEAKIEPTIKNIIETSEPSEVAKNQFLGVDNRTIENKKGKKRLEQFEYDDINDQDLKRELASGQTKLISYTES